MAASPLRVEPAVILQALTIAVLLWFGNKVVTVSETVAVHDFRLAALEQAKK